ncbi:conserved hypothetical protein [Candidatus Nitrotoga sp. M5]|nr:conserved hypothetical protein [Candidatus Nitrotoga sp. M5]
MKLPFEPRYFTSILWLALIMFLIWTIGTELGWGNRDNIALPQSKPQKARPVVVPLQPEFALLPLDQYYTEILTRPLFVPTRRPLPPELVSSLQQQQSSSEPIAPPKPTMRKGQFILDGIIITKDKKIALLREVATRKMVRVELGQEINGMQIEKLDRDKITFKQGDEYEEIILKIKAASPPAGQYGNTGRVAPPASAETVPGAPIAAPTSNAGDPRSVFERRRALRQLPPP